MRFSLPDGKTYEVEVDVATNAVIKSNWKAMKRDDDDKDPKPRKTTNL
ncbi:MAG: hypothetical protein ABR568_06260 [Pyrinomonadaceae bacterium]